MLLTIGAATFVRPLGLLTVSVIVIVVRLMMIPARPTFFWLTSPPPNQLVVLLLALFVRGVMLLQFLLPLLTSIRIYQHK